VEFYSTLVDSGSLNHAGEVDRTRSSIDGMFHGVQLELYAVVNRKPVEVSEGASDVIARSKVHYEASNGELYLL